jgi:hypothetical protein
MAKKVKSSKKAKSAKAKGAKSAGNKAKGSSGPGIPLHTVVAFVQWLEKNGHTKEFLDTHGKRRVTLSTPSFQRVRIFVGQKQPGAAAAPAAAGAKAMAGGATLPTCPPGTYRCF